MEIRDNYIDREAFLESYRATLVAVTDELRHVLNGCIDLPADPTTVPAFPPIDSDATTGPAPAALEDERPPRIQRRNQPIDTTGTVWREVRALSQTLGGQVATCQFLDSLGVALSCLRGCLGQPGAGAAYRPAAKEPLLSTPTLTAGLRVMGHQAERVAAWAMPTAGLDGLRKRFNFGPGRQRIDGPVTAWFRGPWAVDEGFPASLARPVLWSEDPPGLRRGVLGLVREAVRVDYRDPVVYVRHIQRAPERTDLWRVVFSYWALPVVRGWTWSGPDEVQTVDDLLTGRHWTDPPEPADGPGILMERSA